MSFFKNYLKGWHFRTNRPSLEPNSTVDVFMAEHDGDVGIAFIGDTRLQIEGAKPEHKEKQVRVAITEFDSNRSVGRGEFVDVVGESSYSG